MTNDNEMQKLTEMETDVIGEVMNISMGAAATAMSTILDKKVSITTPRIQTLLIEEFEFSYLEPVIGVLIRYISRVLTEQNILLLREEDLKRVWRISCPWNSADMVELDEISMSAICEIMNQMMGSAAGALASFLGEPVNISPPEILDTTENVTQLFSLEGDYLVSIKFNLSIDGLVESEFISAMDPRLAKEIVKRSYGVSEMEEASGEQAAAETPQRLQRKRLPVPWLLICLPRLGRYAGYGPHAGSAAMPASQPAGAAPAAPVCRRYRKLLPPQPRHRRSPQQHRPQPRPLIRAYRQPPKQGLHAAHGRTSAEAAGPCGSVFI
jgi:flagellar motor switch protein FliN/FliY